MENVLVHDIKQNPQTLHAVQPVTLLSSEKSKSRADPSTPSTSGRFKTIVYFAKCRSYPSHFLDCTCGTVRPGVPYVRGAKKRKHQKTAAKITPAAIQLPIWLDVATRSRTGRDRVLRCPLIAGGDSGSWGSMQKMNSTRAPVTRQDAR